MRTLLTFLSLLAAVVVGASAQTAPDNLVLVEGGTFKNTNANFHGMGVTLSDFRIGKFEVTQKEWMDVMGSNPSTFKADNLPVETVSWYDCVEYCNKRSSKEGLKPFYKIDREHKDPNNRTDIDDVKWTVTINAGANGYRLPTEVEWEYAASGGQLSKGYSFSGGDDLDQIAWYWKNSGDTNLTGFWSWPRIEANHNQTRAVGAKVPNELGLYDMAGNVREWCWEWYGDLDKQGAASKSSTSETGRVWKGGGWLGGDFCCASSFRASYEANGRGPDQGLRVCRDK